MKAIRVFTDGGCSGNPGPGAWAFIIARDGGTAASSGAEPETTNNRMELTAVIRAFEALTEVGHDRGSVEVHTDSQYVKKGITEWIHAWRRKGWRNSAGDPVKNRELWERLLELTDALEPDWHWVRGHAGDPLNEECDRLVQTEIRRLKKGP